MKRMPKEILEAPLSYLGDTLTQAFQKIGFGCIPVWTQTGCALFIHLDAASIRDCRNKQTSVRLELHEIDGCPILRLEMQVFDQPGDPLKMDCFLNIRDEHYLSAIEALTEQTKFVFHWYDERLKYMRSSGISWPEGQREDAKKMIAWAREIVARTGGGDFNQAKAKFLRENPI